MIYLICAQDSKKRIAEVSKEEDLKSSFWEYVLELTKHKNFLYPYSFYSRLTKQVLPNRVNVIFASEKKKRMPNITNAINCNNIKQILTSYKNNNDDVFILGSKTLIEMFAVHADFLVICTTDELGYVQQYMQDTINFADYNLLVSQENNNFKIQHFVRVPNFLHK